MSRVGTGGAGGGVVVAIVVVVVWLFSASEDTAFALVDVMT
jgi:hypothetical protein